MKRPMHAVRLAVGLFLALGLALLLNPPRSAAQAPRCPSDGRNAPVEVQVLDAPINFHNDRSSAAISRLRGTHGGGPNWRPVGLTVTRMTFSIETRAVVHPLGNRGFCAALAHIKTTIGFDAFDVYIANRYRPGSCAHAVIVEHETAHVGIYRDGLLEFAPQLRRRLADAANAMGPLFLRSSADAAGRLQQQLNQRIRPVLERLKRETSRQNSLLDSPQNYQREQALCNDW